MSSSYARAIHDPLMGTATPHGVVGNASLEATLKKMQEFALGAGGAKNLDLRRLVETICADLAQGDYASEILACYYWACQNVRYMRDIIDVETLKWPILIARTGSGDCDDLSLLIAAMLMTCGNRVQFIVTGFRPMATKPGFLPSHVFVGVETPAGIIPLDAVASDVTAEMLSRARGFLRVPVSGGPPKVEIPSLSGLGASSGFSGTTDFSVYDYPSKVYRYFRASAAMPLQGWFRVPTSNVPWYRRIPENLCAQLPPDAQPAGSGANPRGLIATDRPGVGVFELGRRTSSDAGAKASGMAGLGCHCSPALDGRGTLDGLIFRRNA